MILETERLLLRPWQDTDAVSLFRYACDPRIGPIAGWPAHTSVENSLFIIHSVLSEAETYAVVPKCLSDPVGSVGIMFGEACSAPIKEGEAEIGYWIGVPFWGRGMIPEAVRELQRHAFEDLGCTGLWCGYFDGNEKSKRVQEKCDFEYSHMEQDKTSLQMDDYRIEHFTYLNIEKWRDLRQMQPAVDIFQG